MHRKPIISRTNLAALLHRCSVLLLLVLLGSQVLAQDARLKRANAAYENMAYIEAIKDYEKLLAKKFDKNAMLRLADCYRLTNNFRKAAEVYSKVVNLNQIAPINYFYFAQSLMNAGMYPEAAKWFDRYAKAMPSDPRGAQFAASCRNIQRYFSDSAEVAITPFPHNTKVDEFGPVWYKGGILYSSSRGEGDLVASKYDWNGQPFLDLYYSKMGGEGDKFSRPVLVKGKLNTRFHEATCAWDSVHQLAYFTRNNFFEGKKTADDNGILNLKLFYADVPASGPWTNVRSLPFNSDKYSIGHPAVLAGGNTLLFISDMPGGFGGTDLYQSKREGDAWSTPQNLGPGINSPGNEMFPYVSPDGMLYYSSDGLGGLGGLDVFSYRLGTNAEPQNLGAPINSASDDFGFLIDQAGTWGMLSSNRLQGLGSDDIYVFRYKKPMWNVVVLDVNTGQPIPDAEISLHLPAINRELAGRTDSAGRYRQLLQRNATYQLMVEANQYRVHRAEVSSYGVKAGEVIQDTVYLERPPVLVVTKVLDPATGYPILHAKVRIVGSDLVMETDSNGTVAFYYDPYPEQEQKTFDCPPQVEGDYCFIFTDEGFSEADTLRLTYEWRFGDGQSARGLEVRHCYAKPGNYEVELNLLDASGNLFMNQSSYNLEVRPPKGLFILGPDTAVVGQVATYTADGSSIEGCELEGFGWEWSHGVSAVGATMRHTFTKPGRYTLQLSAAGHGAEAPRACGACVTREVVVIPADQQRKLDQVEDSLKIAWSSPATKAPPANLPCTPQEPENYCYRFTDEGGVASDTMPLIYLWDLGDGHSKEGQEVHHCYERPGVYNVRLEILDPYSRQRISLRTEYELDVQDIRQVYIDSYDTVALGADVAMNAYRSDAAGCKVASVYWNFGDGETAFGPEVTHQYARRGSYRVQMVLQGTDQATGEPCTRCSYKQLQVLPGYRGNELRDSLRQSTSVAAHTKAIPEGTVLLEIVKEGYEKHHLSFDPQVDEGVLKDSVYLKPIVSATTVLVDVRDERTGLRLRDVTILLQDLKTGFALGEFLLQDSTVVLPLEPGQTYYLLARKQGYLTQVESIGPIQKGGVPISLHMNLSIAEIGKSWVIHNLYYDFDKSHIRNDAAIELAKLVVFLDANPQVTIELGSHTDMRGSDAYNLALAQARAESAVAFLHAKGIAIERIIARGYGEQKPVNRCTNGVACSEAEHQENRRTEITILGLKDPIYSLARPVEDIWGTASIMIPSTPSTAGPFTILLGTYTMPKEAAAFEALAGTQYPVTAREMDGFWLYSYGDYPNYDAANANLQAVISRGYPHATVLVVPPFTLPAAVRAGTPITKVGRASLSATGNPDDDGFYAVQVAVLGRSVQPSFLESFGDYRSAMYERDIAGRRVFFVGRYATEQEAMNHLAKIRRTGHGDAFLVRFEHGNKVNLDKIGGQ